MSARLSTAVVVIYVEPSTAEARRLAWTRCLLHCDQLAYDVAGIGEGKTAWLSCEAMLASGEVDKVVTTHDSSRASAPGVEVAGSARTRLSTYSRAARLRRIAELVDSGLSDAEIVRILRSDEGR